MKTVFVYVGAAAALAPARILGLGVGIRQIVDAVTGISRAASRAT